MIKLWKPARGKSSFSSSPSPYYSFFFSSYIFLFRTHDATAATSSCIVSSTRTRSRKRFKVTGQFTYPTQGRFAGRLRCRREVEKNNTVRPTCAQAARPRVACKNTVPIYIYACTDTRIGRLVNNKSTGERISTGFRLRYCLHDRRLSYFWFFFFVHVCVTVRSSIFIIVSSLLRLVNDIVMIIISSAHALQLTVRSVGR